MSYYAVIIAGGVGTRLWPLSREKTPKQVLPLLSDDSIFQISVARLSPLFSPERIMVVANESLTKLLRAEVPEIPEANYIVEPSGKGTAPAISLAAAIIEKRDPGSTMAVLTADHFIGNTTEFREVLASAEKVAAKDFLVTLGITPNFPATGYGYIERGAETATDASNHTAYQVVAFHEKPKLEIATEFISTGRHSWNSGMFVWKAERFLRELQATMPELYQQITQCGGAYGTPEFTNTLAQIWGGVKSETVDYGVMEKATDVVVIPVDFGWNDIGSWATMYEVLAANTEGNIIRNAPHVNINSTDTVVFGNGKLIATVGLKDIIIVDTPDALLVCRRDAAQDVKKIVEQLRGEGKNEYL